MWRKCRTFRKGEIARAQLDRQGFILYFLRFLYFHCFLSASARLMFWRGCNARRLPDYFVISFVFVQDAKPFGNLPARLQLVKVGRADPGLRVRLGIVDDDLHFQGVMIQSPVALRQARLVAARIPKRIVPELIVETNRLDHKSISVPFADRISQIAWIGIFRKWTPVRPNRTPDMSQLKEHEHPARNLNDFKWIGEVKKLRMTVRITA